MEIQQSKIPINNDFIVLIFLVLLSKQLKIAANLLISSKKGNLMISSEFKPLKFRQIWNIYD